MPQSLEADPYKQFVSADADLASSQNWSRLWLSLAGIAAMVATSVDAALLQRKYNIFTGGFLSVDHLKTPIDAVLFFTTSFIADMGVTAPVAAAALWAATRLRLNAKPSVVMVLVIAIAPIVVWTFFAYRLQVYLGQAFDGALTYELSGRSASEILAVVTPHLLAPLLMLMGAFITVVGVIWLFKHSLAQWRQLPEAPPTVGLALRAGTIFLAVLVIICVAWISSISLQKGLRVKLSGSLFSSIGELITDIDRDGYGLLRRPLDPAPLDAGVFPYAIEIPGNGIDENGVGGDLPVDDAQYPEGATSSGDWALKPNVIFFLLESIRADLVGATYNDKVITPVLNELANEGQSATLAFTHNGFTSPSRYHLFSGNLAGAPGSSSIIDDFKHNGYEVAYFSAQDLLFGGPNYDIGYSRVDVAYDAQVEPQRRFTTYATPGSIGLPHQVIVEKVSKFLDGRQKKRPLFLYINFQDTHFPYHHHRVRELVSDAALPRSDIGPDRTAELWATYVNTAANVDVAIGQVLESVRRSLEDPAPGIIVTSDHGESLYDDGFLGHGIVLNDIQSRIPFIVANLPMVIEQPIGLVDFRATLRSAMESASTVDLTPVLTRNPERRVFQYLGNFHHPRQIAVRDLSGRNIYDFRTGRFQSNGGPWLRPHELSESDVEAFRSLVHQWERMVLAASAAK